MPSVHTVSLLTVVYLPGMVPVWTLQNGLYWLKVSLYPYQQRGGFWVERVYMAASKMVYSKNCLHTLLQATVESAERFRSGSSFFLSPPKRWLNFVKIILWIILLSTLYKMITMLLPVMCTCMSRCERGWNEREGEEGRTQENTVCQRGKESVTKFCDACLPTVWPCCGLDRERRGNC